MQISIARHEHVPCRSCGSPRVACLSLRVTGLACRLRVACVSLACRLRVACVSPRVTCVWASVARVPPCVVARFASCRLRVAPCCLRIQKPLPAFLPAELEQRLADSAAINVLRMVSKLVGHRPEVLPIAFFHKCLQIDGTCTKLRTTVVGWSWYLPYSFQGSFFPENLRKARENCRFLNRTMIEQNGESTPGTAEKWLSVFARLPERSDVHPHSNRNFTRDRML